MNKLCLRIFANNFSDRVRYIRKENSEDNDVRFVYIKDSIILANNIVGLETNMLHYSVGVEGSNYKLYAHTIKSSYEDIKKILQGYIIEPI